MAKKNNIKFDERNYRLHPEENKNLIAKSLQELGAGRSIVIDNEGSIIAGNGVFEQAQKLGIPIEVIETDGSKLIVLKRTDLATSDKKRKELALADNSTSDSSVFDFEVLAEDWDVDELADWGVDFPEDEEGEEIELGASEDDYDGSVPEIPQTVLGDLYEIGDHRLLCGDSTDSDAVSKLMGGNIADALFTDPPHEIEQDNFLSYADLFCSGVKFVLHNDKYLAKLSAQYIDRFERFFVHDFIFHIGGGNRFFTQNDLIACFDYSSDIYQNLHDGFSTVIRKMTERQKGTANLEHPHKKPSYLVELFLTHFSKEGSLWMDFYLGSGTTMTTCHEFRRKCYGMELAPKYCDVIIRRMHKLDPKLKIKRNGIDI